MSRQGIVSIRIWMICCEGKSGKNIWWLFNEAQCSIELNIEPHWTLISYKRNHNELSYWPMISMPKRHSQIRCVNHAKSRKYVWFLQINVFPLTGIIKASSKKVCYFLNCLNQMNNLVFTKSRHSIWFSKRKVLSLHQ